MRSSFRERLDVIPWSEYQTAYGNAAGEHKFETAVGQPAGQWGSVPNQLAALASANPERALEAAHHLWCCLCHQHAYVSSAALPSLPFLLEVLDDAGDQLTIEILDILTGFAICTRMDDNQNQPSGWIAKLRAGLVQELPRFQVLVRHHNEEIADWARSILDELER